MVHPDGPAMTDTTTIQVSRAQRAEIAAIKNRLAAERRRNVTTAEVVGALLDAWRKANGEINEGNPGARVDS